MKKLLMIGVALMLGCSFFLTSQQAFAASSIASFELTGEAPSKEIPKIPDKHQETPNGMDQSTGIGKLPQTGVKQQNSWLSFVGLGLVLLGLLGTKKQMKIKNRGEIL